MNRMIIIILAALINFGASIADMDSLFMEGKSLLKEAYFKWDEDLTIRSRAHFERLIENPDLGWLAKYYMALADYRLNIMSQQKNDKKKSLFYIDEGIELLERSIEAKPDFEESYSLISSFLGQKISLKPFSAMSLGPKSNQFIEKSFEVSSNNPRNYLFNATSLFFRPAMFGGSKTKAIENMRQALEHFETFQPEKPIYPDWGKPEAYGWLGNFYTHEGKLDSADFFLKQALNMNPEFEWVTRVLLPNLEKAKNDE